MNAIVDNPAPQFSLVTRTAQRFGVDAEKLLPTLKATAFKTERPVTNEQMMALLIVAEQYRLNPFTREIYAYPDKFGGITPVVSVDGWTRIVQEHPQFDGWDFVYDSKEQSYTCTIWRKDRSHPTVITEYLVECRRETDPWKRMPRRMLRHKSLIQCARVAFGFAGIYDEEEAQDIMRGAALRAVGRPQASNAERVDRALRDEPFEDVEAMPVSSQEALEQMIEPDPPAPTLESYKAQLEKAEDSFVAEMLIEEARDLLSDEEMGTLAALFAARFADPQEDNRE